MSCKLTSTLGEKKCAYVLAGAKELYLANHYPAVFSTSATAGADGVITYKTDTDGNVTNVYLPDDEVFFPLIAEENTINFSDVLQAGANNNRYRLHSVTAISNTDAMFEGTTLTDIALGKYIAVVVDNSGQVLLLGTNNGLSAPANGADYNSGTAVADAVGFTVLLQNPQTDTLKRLPAPAVITPKFTVTP